MWDKIHINFVSKTFSFLIFPRDHLYTLKFQVDDTKVLSLAFCWLWYLVLHYRGSSSVHMCLCISYFNVTGHLPFFNHPLAIRFVKVVAIPLLSSTDLSKGPPYDLHRYTSSSWGFLVATMAIYFIHVMVVGSTKLSNLLICLLGNLGTTFPRISVP